MKFTDLNLNKQLLNALDDLGLTEPTAIQEKSFSTIMSGRDVVGIAQTGTGKTFAFLLPTLRLWKFSKSPFPQTLIIVPTRELVAQVVEEIDKLTTYMNVVAVGAYGGTNMITQKDQIHKGADYVVGTPGRLLDLFLDGVLKSKNMRHVIIDEVDEMLNLGFRTQLKNLLDFLPEKRQNLMFSATMTEEVQDVIYGFSKFFEKIEAAPSGAPLENIQQTVYELPNFNSKANMLEHLLNTDQSITKMIVFASSKKMADVLFEHIGPKYEGNIGVIHSSKSQNNRFDTVDKFLTGEYRVIIATDIIARGLDISGVSHVLNFGLTEEAERYIHRIGRTGRAEEKGIAISFVQEEEKHLLHQIEELMGQKIEPVEVPEGVVISEELIALEVPSEYVPFNNHKMRTHIPSGDAFHEKAVKNQKVNKKIRHVELMKIKYGKPKTRPGKQNRKKK